MASWKLPLLWLLGSRPVPGAFALKTRCPVGYYRDSAIVWDCSGSRDSAWFYLEADVRVGVALDVGVLNFQGKASANLDVDLQLYDPKADAYALKPDGGDINDERKTGDYQGLEISYSGDKKKALPCKEAVTLRGATPTKLWLFFHNEFNKEGMVQLNFSYDGLQPCPLEPPGCAVYRASSAEKHVETWSRWAQSHYLSAKEAWREVSREKLDSVVHWYMFRKVWSRPLPEGKTDESWRMAFHFLDGNADDSIDLQEFTRGFYLYGWSPEEAKSSVGAWREWLCAEHGYGGEAAWKAFAMEGAVGRQDWQDMVWKDWFSSFTEALKVPANVSFDFLDKSRDNELSREEFLAGYSPSPGACAGSTPPPAAATASVVALSTTSRAAEDAKVGAAGGAAAAPAALSWGELFDRWKYGLLLGALTSLICCVLPVGMLLCCSGSPKKKTGPDLEVSFSEEDSEALDHLAYQEQLPPAPRTASKPEPLQAARQPWWKVWTMYPAQPQFKYTALPVVELAPWPLSPGVLVPATTAAPLLVARQPSRPLGSGALPMGSGALVPIDPLGSGALVPLDASPGSQLQLLHPSTSFQIPLVSAR